MVLETNVCYWVLYDAGYGAMVFVLWCWYCGAGIVVLGLWYWYFGTGTVVLVQVPTTVI